MVRTTWFMATLSACFGLLSCSVGYAGTLNLHGDALPGWTGTIPFNNGSGLMGTIDYAVFTAADFNANFAGDGYVPGGPVVYTYQVFNTGTDHVSTELVGIVNPANTIGTFDTPEVNDVNALTAAFVGSNAEWFFNPAIDTGESSWGLAFSSPNLPMVGAGVTINGGSAVIVVGLPTPSDIPIPEPASIALLACGGMLAFLRRRVN